MLHPSMAVVYRERVAALHEALQQDDTRAQAAEVIRSLVSEIVLTPEDGALQIDVRGDLAGILTIAASGNQKSPPLAGTGSGGGSQVMMVAGNRSHHDLRWIEEWAAQAKAVAGKSSDHSWLFRAAA